MPRITPAPSEEDDAAGLGADPWDHAKEMVEMEENDRSMYRNMIRDAASGLPAGAELRLTVLRLGGWTENGWWEAVICRPQDVEALMRGDTIDGTHLTFDERQELIVWLSGIGAVPADPVPVRPEELAGFTCAVALA